MKNIKSIFSVLLITGLLTSFTVVAPAKITWETLRDVIFQKKWDADQGMFVLYPKFGDKVKSYAGKEILITGYMIPVDIDANYYVLSANPFAACFFCGQSGPESVASIKFKKLNKRYNTDDRVTIKGTLRLNVDDINELNYILENAEQIL
jgi:hypothetical protein